MTDWRATRTATLAMLLLACAAMWSQAQEADKGKGDAKTTAPPPAPAAKGVAAAQSSQGLGAFGKVLPIGEVNEDVKIPSFKDGSPSSTVRAATMVRLDDENMEMSNMHIRLFGKTLDDDVHIRLYAALYHMPSQILSSNKRSRVTRADFDLSGDSMIFDSRTGQGKMTGNVRMVIYDAESFTADSKSGPDGNEEKATEDKEKRAATEAPAPVPAPTPTTTTSPSLNEKK